MSEPKVWYVIEQLPPPQLRYIKVTGDFDSKEEAEAALRRIQKRDVIRNSSFSVASDSAEEVEARYIPKPAGERRKAWKEKASKSRG